MNKKIIALVLAVLMMFAFAACAGQKNNDINDVADEQKTTAGDESASKEETTGKTETDAKNSDLDYIKNKGKLIVGMTDYAPMNYKEKGSNEWTGFDTEFAQAVAKELGVEVEFIEIEWDNKFSELDSKAIDCIWNGMTITDEVNLNTSVSKAYVVNAQVVVMAKDKLDSFKDAESLKELKIAVEAGSAGEKEAKAIEGAEVIAVKTQADALLEVKSGSVDACIIDITMANAMTGEGTSYADLGYELKLSTEEYGISFRKGSDMTETVNELMAKLKEDGTLPKLAEKYELTLA